MTPTPPHKEAMPICNISKSMLFARKNFSIRPTTIAVPVSVLLIGMLRAQAVPAPRTMVPLGNTTAAPTGTQATDKGLKPVAVAPKPAPKDGKSTPKGNKPAVVAKPRTGEEVYQQVCASCHGAKGEGGKGYRSALIGDQSISELASFIEETMPPGAPRKLPTEEARRVADYIFNTFYSPIAQERNRPPRIELSRLTVRQYRNAVTDLIATFRKAEQAEKGRGLSGKYFKTREANDLALERIDPEIHFDYSNCVAIPEQDDPYQFVMHWNGSVLAPDTGEYEFILRTEQSAILWLNDLRQPLVDGRIQSGTANEYRASIFLLGGRRYPLKLEFFKGVRGVDNLKKLKEKPVQKASISLEWKMPHRPVEVIPQRNLLPSTSPQKFVLTTPFPPDDRSIGYERGTAISKEWDEATTEAALETAEYIVNNLRDLSGVPNEAPDRDKKIREFCRRFAARAFGRPISDELAQFFVDRHFKDAANLDIAVKRSILLILKSPRFLYREIGAAPEPKPAPTTGATEISASAKDTTATATPVTAAPATAVQDPYEIASRLSFAMWDSLPDEELLKAAAAGKLATREQVFQQAERLSNDQRAWFKMRDFLLMWLKVEHYPDLAKDKKRYPNFDEAVASDLRTSLELSLEQLVWGEKSDFRELMLTDKFFLNGRLAAQYGVPLRTDAPFQEVKMDDGKRSGVLTHPYLLSSFAYIDDTSPIHRGVLIARNMLGRTLMPPPEAFTPLAADLHPKLTTRQRVALQTKPAACASCHNMINPLGFSLERFDATGNLRTEDNGVPVDATGSYLARTGKEYKFTDARDLANFLADSEEVHGAFTEKLFHHTVKQPIRAFGTRTLSKLEQTFKANDFNMRRLMIEMAVLTAVERQTGAAETNTPSQASQDKPHDKGIPKT